MTNDCPPQSCVSTARTSPPSPVLHSRTMAILNPKLIIYSLRWLLLERPVGQNKHTPTHTHPNKPHTHDELDSVCIVHIWRSCLTIRHIVECVLARVRRLNTGTPVRGSTIRVYRIPRMPGVSKLVEKDKYWASECGCFSTLKHTTFVLFC